MVNFKIVDRKGLYCFISNLYNLHNHHCGKCLFSAYGRLTNGGREALEGTRLQ